MSLNNEWAPTYRARHPHVPSASFPWVPTYGVEYPQGASAQFSCFYNNTSTDTNCCCCCCQYKLSAGSRKEQIVNTAGSTSGISSNTASTASSISSITASTASTAGTANFTVVQFRAFYPKIRICMATKAIWFCFSEVKKKISLKHRFYRLFDTNFSKSFIP